MGDKRKEKATVKCLATTSHLELLHCVSAQILQVCESVGRGEHQSEKRYPLGLFFLNMVLDGALSIMPVFGHSIGHIIFILKPFSVPSCQHNAHHSTTQSPVFLSFVSRLFGRLVAATHTASTQRVSYFGTQRYYKIKNWMRMHRPLQVHIQVYTGKVTNAVTCNTRKCDL